MSVMNASPYAALAVPYLAPDGREVVVAIVKATFRRTPKGRRAVPSAAQIPVRVADIVWDPEAPQSSIRYPSDVGTEKRGADVIVVGDAVSAKPVKQLDVIVRVADRDAPLRVHGERLYYRGVGGAVAIGPAAAFERAPIVYEHAYGGTTPDASRVERRNPVGRGVALRPSELVDQPAPTIEHPARPIDGAGESEPMGYGAIASSWLPRSAFVGTVDEAWQRTRMPLMPADFDIRYFNVAHPALQLPEPIRGGETLSILGMTLDGPFSVDLPEVPVVLRAKRDDGAWLEARPLVDTVLVEPDDDRIELTLRHSFPKGRGRTLLREIRVDSHE